MGREALTLFFAFFSLPFFLSSPFSLSFSICICQTLRRLSRELSYLFPHLPLISIDHPPIHFPILTHSYSYRLTVLHMKLILTPAWPANLSRKKTWHSRSNPLSLPPSLHSTLSQLTVIAITLQHRRDASHLALPPPALLLITNLPSHPLPLPFPLTLHRCSPPAYLSSNTSQNFPTTCPTQHHSTLSYLPPCHPTTPPASTAT